MKTVYQNEKDNCLSACLASILELDITDVPNFYTDDTIEFWRKVNSWLDKKDLKAIAWSDRGLKQIQKNHKDAGYGIVTMKSKDNNTSHAFVSFNGIVFHDPSDITSPIMRHDENSAVHFSLIKKFKGH